MAITNFVSELWAAAVLKPFQTALVWGQPGVVNRDYEGEITQQGDTVHVTSIADPTVRAYDKTTDLTEEDVTDSTTEMLIDQGDYFDFRVNDIDKVQAAGNFQSAALQQAGFKMAKKVDTFLGATAAAGVASGNRKSAQILTAASDAYDLLVDLGTVLDQADAPDMGRFAIVPPDYYNLLLKSSLFAQVNQSGTEQGLRNGIVGRANGFDVLKSNNCPSNARTVADGATTSSSKTVTSATAKFSASDVGAKITGAGIPAGTTVASVESATSLTTSANSTATATGVSITIDAGSKLVTAGINIATSFAMQLTEVEALRSQARFADVVRGLQVYGGKVFHGDGLATASYTIALA